MYRHENPPNCRSFADTLKTGNPASIIAFNPVVVVPVVCHTQHEDYTAGETAAAWPECPGAWVDSSGHKARYHILSCLGPSWCKGEPRFPDELVIGYTKHVTTKGGVITWDVPIQKNGLIPQPFLRQLGALLPALRPNG